MESGDTGGETSVPSGGDSSSNPNVVRRPRWLTGLLVWFVAANLIAAATAPFLLVPVRRKTLPDFPEWVVWPFESAVLVAAVSAGAVLYRKRWGVFGYSAAAIGVFAINVYAGLAPSAAALGLTGTAVMIGALFVGGKNREWANLR